MRAWIVIAVFAAAACGSVNTNNGAADASSEEDGGPSEAHYQFVISQLIVPITSADAEAYGLDIDGDGTVDNNVGQAMAAVFSSGYDPRPSVDRGVATGATITLIDIETTSLDAASDVNAWWLRGSNPLPPACNGAGDTVCGRHLNGGATFSVATASPDEAVLSGNIIAGALRAGPNQRIVEIGVPLPYSESIIIMPLVAARLEIATVTASWLDGGVLGGAILDSDVRSIYLPALAADVTGLLTMEGCTPSMSSCNCPIGGSPQAAADLFDADGDCMVTVAEVQSNSLVTSLLAPDLDLFDSTGAFNPRVDGVNEALSIGYGFSAAHASFPAPAP